MKATFELDEVLLRRPTEEAARRGVTVSRLVEEGVRLVLSEPAQAAARKPLPPLPSWSGGTPRVDIADRDALDRVMEEDA